MSLLALCADIYRVRVPNLVCRAKSLPFICTCKEACECVCVYMLSNKLQNMLMFFVDVVLVAIRNENDEINDKNENAKRRDSIVRLRL